MDFNFSEREKMRQALVRESAAKEVLPRAVETDRSAEFAIYPLL